ncbi:MAG TPA: hypothetical protein P5186_13325 [Candidatus Paceibacterota bacterium]|nr:hypothetical protein [Verrucomicrobiota bacterium]HRY49022.1 hypothetical protein [Candidatus Paceibacterota bacterium]HSA02727.1 hypothetical protein [Candidatus Paceibacterota bacterium]
MNPPVCRHLRTKKMFIPFQNDSAPGVAEEISGQHPHFWCNRTLTEVGQDDQPVDPCRCREPRACFED